MCARLALGLDYCLSRQLGVRADYRFQHWTIVPGDFPFNPRVLSFGVAVYRIPYKPLRPLLAPLAKSIPRDATSGRAPYLSGLAFLPHSNGLL